MNDKKIGAQKVWSKDLMHEKHFGFIVIHYGENLITCRGLGSLGNAL